MAAALDRLRTHYDALMCGAWGNAYVARGAHTGNAYRHACAHRYSAILRCTKQSLNGIKARRALGCQSGSLTSRGRCERRSACAPGGRRGSCFCRCVHGDMHSRMREPRATYGYVECGPARMVVCIPVCAPRVTHACADCVSAPLLRGRDSGARARARRERAACTLRRAQLAAPSVKLSPSLEDIQRTLNKVRHAAAAPVRHMHFPMRARDMHSPYAARARPIRHIYIPMRARAVCIPRMRRAPFGMCISPCAASRGVRAGLPRDPAGVAVSVRVGARRRGALGAPHCLRAHRLRRRDCEGGRACLCTACAPPPPANGASCGRPWARPHSRASASHLFDLMRTGRPPADRRLPRHQEPGR